MASSEDETIEETRGTLGNFEEMEIKFKKDKARVKSNFTRSRNKVLNLLDQDDLPSQKDVRQACQNMDTCQEEAIGVLTNFADFYTKNNEEQKSKDVVREMDKIRKDYNLTSESAREYLESRKSDNSSVSSDILSINLLENMNISDKSETYCKKDSAPIQQQRSSKVTGPTDNLKEIKKLFRTDKSWQARLVKPHMGIDSSTDNKLVFVVEFPNGKPNLEQGERDALPGTELEFRCPNDRSNELTFCIDKTINSTLNDTDTELKIISAIKENREQLHKNHSKLSEIRLSKVKSSGFGTKDAKIKEMYCIALVVPYKGLIPVDENNFPPTIKDFPTDVWEGQISPLYHPASHQALSQLLMGASIEIKTDTAINSCTIGPLIQHEAKGETKKTYILSVAHGTVKDCERTIIEPVENLTDTQSNNMLCYQPNSSVDESPFGKVVKRVLAWNRWDRWIDAALIEITNQDKIPTGGYFPDSEDSFEMFCGRAMAFNSGRLIKREEAPEFTVANDKKKFVYKYGATTGLTKGYICKRYDDRYFEVRNDRHNFCQPGDSGSLVLLFEQNARCPVHSDHQKHKQCSCLVRALGIIVGTNQVTTQCLYISDCLENLGIHDVEECLSFSKHDSVPPLRST